MIKKLFQVSVAMLICTAVQAHAHTVDSTTSEKPQAHSEKILLAQTDGQERRDDRSDDRNDRQDDRQDCRTAEGAGADKRDCKQDARQDEEASTDG